MEERRGLSSRAVGLLFQNPADRKVLETVLAERYRVISSQTQDLEAPEWKEVESIIIDAPSARRLGSKLQELKARSGRPLVPALLVLAQADDADPWLEAGIDDILRMPLKKADLFLRLKSLEVMSDQAVAQVASKTEDVYQTIFNGAGDGILVFDPQSMAILQANQTLLDLFGYTQKEIQQRSFEDLFIENQQLGFSHLWQGLPDNSMKKRPALVECSAIDQAGQDFWVGISLMNIQVGGENRLLAIVRDMEKRKQLEEQLRQSQKIESVGRLAGGVAHEYNNMLSVIIGYTELVQMKLGSNSEARADLEEVLNAATRSRDITRQLLAFARKQTLSPKVIDLNATVESMLKMLRQLLGENIDLAWLPKEGMEPVEMDPSQLDQILANLCVNARDAITNVGKITIETGEIQFDQEYCGNHPGFIPGEFVMLAVSDNGCGMEQTILEQIFEPFFTTKSVGEGTGLGLSMVYGAVKQSKGFINVYSELGQGTTFKVYLPCYRGETAVEGNPLAGEVLQGRGEGVLLVEDESALLKLTQTILNDLGYEVLAAQSPQEAITLAQKHPDEIELLITDVVMPGMNGRELANRLRLNFPRLKCLYMSGYTKNAIVHHGVLDKGVHFIHKPFSRSEFSVKIRNILGLVP